MSLTPGLSLGLSRGGVWTFSSEGSIRGDWNAAVTSTVLSTAHSPIQNGDVVTGWNDNSGRGDANRNATPIAAGVGPTYTAANPLFGGKPTLGVSANGHALATGAFSGGAADPFTLFVVGSASINTQNPAQFVGGGPGNSTRTFGWNTVSGAFGITESLTLTAVLGSIPAGVYAAVFNGASSAVYASAKTPIATGNVGTAVTTQSYAFFGSGSNTANQGGATARILMYDGALSNAAVGRVIARLGQLYGITIGA